MNTGTWNAWSLLWSGALTVRSGDLSKLDFDVVALQETRLKTGIQKLITSHYLMVYQKVRSMNLAAGFM